MGWLSVFSALAYLFGSLSSVSIVFGDSPVGGAKEARLSALVDAQRRSRRWADITAHLDTLDDDEFDPRLRQYQCASGRLRMGKANHRRRG